MSLSRCIRLPRSIALLAALLMVSPGSAATLLDSLDVRFYRSHHQFPTADTVPGMSRYGYAVALQGSAPGCGELSIDSASVVPGNYPPIVRIVVSRVASTQAGCRRWRRQRVLAPVAETPWRTGEPVAAGGVYRWTDLAARIVLAGARDSVTLTTTGTPNASRFVVHGGDFPRPTSINSCSNVSPTISRWGFSSVDANFLPDLRRRIDTSRTAGIRVFGAGLWMPPGGDAAEGAGLPLEIRGSFTTLPAAPWHRADRVFHSARRLGWERSLHGDTAGFPALAATAAGVGHWKIRLQGARADGGDSIVGDTLRLAGRTAEIEFLRDELLRECNMPAPPRLPDSGTRWLELRLDSAPLAAVMGPAPGKGEEWILLRGDSILSAHMYANQGAITIVASLQELLVGVGVGQRAERASAAPRVWRSGRGWVLEVPESAGARAEVEVVAPDGERLLALHGQAPGRIDLGDLPKSGAILLVRIRGEQAAWSMRLPALR